MARAIHYLGLRRDAPFIPVNCGALPESLVENELFGHTRGAFTDARSDHAGLLQLAHGGTLFLDEVNSLSPKAQVVLLRFMQDRRFRPLGARTEEYADVRVIAASNRPLEVAVRAGEFRSDLYYRLKLAEVTLPPLRARTGDVELLTAHFIRECAKRYSAPERPVDAQTLLRFRQYDWPGNIRELEHLIHREFLMSEGIEIHVRPPGVVEPPAQTASEVSAGCQQLEAYVTARGSALEQFDRSYLQRILRQTRGNVTEAARLAGKERRAFGKLIKRYQMSPDSFRSPG